MKIALYVLGTFAVIYALFTKRVGEAASTQVNKGALGPAYNPVATIWSERQSSSTTPAQPANPIIGFQNSVPVNVPNDPTATNIINTAILAGAGSKGRPSITATAAGDCNSPFPIVGACPGQPANPSDLSPTFWAADKVPINVNMPGSDADPFLATDWSVV